MSEVFSVPLLDLQSRRIVEASLHVEVDFEFATRADDAWRTYLAAENANRSFAGMKAIDLEHDHWEWAKKHASSSHLLASQMLGIEYAEEVQGMMVLWTGGYFGRLAEQTQQPLVYVEYVATAPWNLPTVTARPKFKGVGSVMMKAAIQISRSLEFKGRLGLHSLPRAEGWYNQVGFDCLGEDPKQHDLKYYELTAKRASDYQEGRAK